MQIQRFMGHEACKHQELCSLCGQGCQVQLCMYLCVPLCQLTWSMAYSKHIVVLGIPTNGSDGFLVCFFIAEAPQREQDTTTIPILIRRVIVVLEIWGLMIHVKTLSLELHVRRRQILTQNDLTWTLFHPSIPPAVYHITYMYMQARLLCLSVNLFDVDRTTSASTRCSQRLNFKMDLTIQSV